MAHIPAWVVGVMLAAGIALVARRAGSLSASGAAAAAVLGTAAMAAGWDWGVVLILYFVSTSLLSRFQAAEKLARLGDRVAKGDSRDAVQVLANGGAFAGAALAYAWSESAAWQSLAAAALAASAADTWATEIGMLSPSQPRSLRTMRPVSVGTSGGVTALGLLAGLGGAGMVAGLAWMVGWPTRSIVSALAGGIIGCVFDSVLGASLQARRWCATCHAQTEQRVHRCGATTSVAGGLRWLDNDGVNVLSTIVGALFGAAAASYL